MGASRLIERCLAGARDHRARRNAGEDQRSHAQEVRDGTSVHPQCTAHGAYVQGNDRSICDTGNGATSCLVGDFGSAIVSGYVTGPIDPTSGPSDILVVQLIK